MMTKDKPLRDVSLDSVNIPALSSITPEQASTIRQAVLSSRPEWEVQANYDYEGYLSILIAPRDSDHNQKSFFIAGSAQRLELFEAHGDEMASIGVFDRVEPLSVHVVGLVTKQ